MKTLQDLKGSRWAGKGELWLDPKGNEAAVSDCTCTVEDGTVRYTWSHEGKEHKGSIELREGGAVFHDTFHSADPMEFKPWPVPGAVFSVIGSYSVGGGPAWGWRIVLAVRPSDELVLQMTNVTPWGEDGRAVRMVFQKAG
jgi:hypothetical protein